MIVITPPLLSVPDKRCVFRAFKGARGLSSRNPRDFHLDI
jgi:hypothetical protein